MKKSYFVLIALFMVGAFIILYMYIANTRFTLITTKGEVAYKKLIKKQGRRGIVFRGRE